MIFLQKYWRVSSVFWRASLLTLVLKSFSCDAPLIIIVGFSLQLEPVLTLVNAFSSDASCSPTQLHYLHEIPDLCQICNFTLHLVLMVLLVDSNNP